MDDPRGMIHWAAQWFRVGTRLRQRCGWCGAVLVDVDLASIARPTEDWADVDPADPTMGYPTWETACFVEHDGNVWVALPDPEGETPEGCCTRLDPEVTA